MIRGTLVSCAAGALALFVVLSPAAPQAQGPGGPPAQLGQQGGFPALAARVQTLEAAVKQLQEEVAAEIAARTAADAAESLARAAADTTLQGNIDAEAAARAAADSTLQNDIANEAAARAAANTTLQGNIDALQARITTLGDQVTALQQLFESLNPAMSTAQQNIADLRTDLDALEDKVDMLGGGLTSYDQLAGLECTNAQGAASTVYLVGTFKTPVCARSSTNGRFHDVGQAVFDTQTNLMWEKKTTAVGSGQNFADLHDVDNRYSWCVATGNSAPGTFCAGNATSWIGQVNAEVFAGFSNWRVPTRDELLTIVDMTTGPPRIDPIFGPTQASFYWSATERDLNFALVVLFLNGGVGLVNKNAEFHVRAVRAGP